MNQAEMRERLYALVDDVLARAKQGDNVLATLAAACVVEAAVGARRQALLDTAAVERIALAESVRRAAAGGQPT